MASADMSPSRSHPHDATRSPSPRTQSPSPRDEDGSRSPGERTPSPPSRDPSPYRSPGERTPSPSPRRDRSLSPRDQPHSHPRSRSPTPRSQSPSRRSVRSPSPRQGSPARRVDRSSSPRARSPPPRRHSRSPPLRGQPPPPRHRDAGGDYRPVRKERTPTPPPVAVKTEEEKLADARAEYQKLLNLRSQGVYLPPHRLRALQAAITDKKTREYQRMAWEALKKSVNGLVNKVNTANIKFVVPELFGENLIRGRGLFCQSLLKAQHASLPFTPIYACLAAICNTKLPQVGELLVKRLVLRFRKAFKRNDKAVCLSSTMFIAHLVNNQVVHEMIAAQILLLLLAKPTDDSVEIAVGLMREVGLFLEEMSPAIAHAVFDQFRNILHEADIDRRTQYMIEVLFQVRKDKYKDNPVIKEELDLVEEEDQITHRIGLDDEIDPQDGLNVFKMDPNWEENEEEYKKLKAEILGEASDDDEDDDDDDESESGSESEDEEQKALEIKDQSNADLVNLRRTIYLSIQSSADPEEAAHKLMKLRLPAGQEAELVSMIVESCAQEKVYLKFMGLLGERFARLNRMWMDLFEESFAKYYSTIHRYETNKLRNIARFFGHLLATDAIGWHVFSVIHLNEEETTSASRIFIKILFEDLQENIGSAKLKARMSEETLQPSLQGIFPHDEPRNIRFSINYFTSIKMGYLTDEMRTFLANMPKPALPAPPADSDSESVSSYSSYSSYSSRSRSRSLTPRKDTRGRSLSRTPPRRGRGRSYSRTPSRSRSRSRSYSRSVSKSVSRSPPRRRAVESRSPSPPPRGRGRSYDRYSRSPSRSRSRTRSPAAAPPIRRGRSGTRSRSRSYSRSPSPPPARGYPTRGRAPVSNNDRAAAASGKRRREGSYSASRSPHPPPQQRLRRGSYSRSRSRSPIPIRGNGPAGRDTGRAGPAPARGGRRNRSYSRSRTRSPPPLADAATGSRRVVSRSPSPVVGNNKRRRSYSSSRSRSRSSSRSRYRSRSPVAKRGRVD
ncbi:MIF4G-domain-containing protein [Neurospora crassa]|uniref:Pre-mRNA-splicing factor cwc22 n=1 Tax=Neurospora crassa (strain ATCC 24698 / 74-OR23-1A / CBS 708.71 / DSM 1257 / FGSC 987) TaxID=367110 RepID=CWC22_NEUCR|nr:pre-mRNA-splicing factor cwc-22 [Neurospora crassa OR74A]Q7RX84.1 RecName: Full=Pre-mRNA-splicing factor cwc22; AltName: Full=mRNA-splicing protein-1 [Neurospora crassa OR74A]EAA27140.3 pre-mRNA-splicing factor cwc-22 [Neurospora crassa OR74A]KHE79644.1 MIF4G-domain-containing protein [Neurospora crassa]|eukprot:XP_956376.3 pre-mRNA-splicing factor cwc-22 [Neurospora crassa OR74A]